MFRLASALLVLVAAAAPVAAAHAEVYKCTEADGRKVYQDQPCKAGQQEATYDPSRANVTTIDSETASREAQEALVTRAAARDQEDDDRDADRRVESGSNDTYVPVYQQPETVYYPYPVYRNNGYGHGHHDHDHDGPHVPLRPDDTPMSRPQRGGGGYVPKPPTIRDIAPRPPAAPRGRTSPSRDDDR